MTQHVLPLTPYERYQRDLAQEGFGKDVAQAQAIGYLQALYEQLLMPVQQSLWGRLLRKPLPVVKGLYFWGGVGRGKTYLMDIFFDALPFEQKMRTHFHRFMQRVHQELAQLGEIKNPLERVADVIAGETRVICFDEFFVSDITDAMILAGLLDALFQRGVTLVTTSNIEPQGLYLNGLQRSNFLPAIELLLKHTQVVNVDGGVDYRLRALQQAALFYTPLNRDAQQSLQACFERLVSDAAGAQANQPISIEGRNITAYRLADSAVWFTFEAICDGPRSQRDYIEVARQFHTVLVSGVPLLGGSNEDQARRFIYMVDEFYDRNIKLVLSADKPIACLYRKEGRLSFEFERTQSRLLEMQSEEYLARPHKP